MLTTMPVTLKITTTSLLKIFIASRVSRRHQSLIVLTAFPESRKRTHATKARIGVKNTSGSQHAWITLRSERCIQCSAQVGQHFCVSGVLRQVTKTVGIAPNIIQLFSRALLKNGLKQIRPLTTAPYHNALGRRVINVLKSDNNRFHFRIVAYIFEGRG